MVKEKYDMVLKKFHSACNCTFWKKDVANPDFLFNHIIQYMKLEAVRSNTVVVNR